MSKKRTHLFGRMRKHAPLFFWIALVGTFGIGAMYLSAMIIAPKLGLQITGMMEFERGSRISIFYGWFYTGSLLAAAAAGFLAASTRVLGMRAATILCSGFVLALTLLPLVYSFLWNYDPSKFENYVGESLTCVAALVLAMTVRKGSGGSHGREGQ